MNKFEIDRKIRKVATKSITKALRLIQTAPTDIEKRVALEEEVLGRLEKRKANKPSDKDFGKSWRRYEQGHRVMGWPRLKKLYAELEKRVHELPIRTRRRREGERLLAELDWFDVYFLDSHEEYFKSLKSFINGPLHKILLAIDQSGKSALYRNFLAQALAAKLPDNLAVAVKVMVQPYNGPNLSRADLEKLGASVAEYQSRNDGELIELLGSWK